MVRKTLVGVVCSLVILSQVQASYLRIEEEGDVERVSNNVTYFWTSHTKELKVLLNKDLYKESLDETLQVLKYSPTELAKEIRENPKEAINTINHSVKFLKKLDLKTDIEIDRKIIKTCGNGLLLLRNVINEVK